MGNIIFYCPGKTSDFHTAHHFYEPGFISILITFFFMQMFIVKSFQTYFSFLVSLNWYHNPQRCSLIHCFKFQIIIFVTSSGGCGPISTYLQKRFYSQLVLQKDFCVSWRLNLGSWLPENSFVNRLYSIVIIILKKEIFAPTSILYIPNKFNIHYWQVIIFMESANKNEWGL